MLETLTFVTTLGAAVMGGVFYAFSTGVMQALGRLPSPQGAAAMQSVNIAVINPLFLGLFLGTAALCLGLCVAAPFTWDESGSGWRLTGALLYLVVLRRHGCGQRAAQQRARHGRPGQRRG